MFKLGDRLINPASIHCIDFDPAGGASIALAGAPSRAGDRTSSVRVIRVGVREAEALKAYFCTARVQGVPGMAEPHSLALDLLSPPRDHDQSGVAAPPAARRP